MNLKNKECFTYANFANYGNQTKIIRNKQRY